MSHSAAEDGPHALDDLGDLARALEGMTTRWMTGGAAAPHAPPAWRAALQALDGGDGGGASAPGAARGAAREAAQELAALALAAQASAVALRRTPPRAPAKRPVLETSPPLPRLASPSPPPPIRARFRAILTGGVRRGGGAPVDLLLRLMAARGYAAHPADWFPPLTFNAAAPGLEIYAPWVAWREGASSSLACKSDGAPEIDAESWDQFAPSDRVAALRALRRRAPEVARVLIEAQMAVEAADHRLRLLETLEAGLTAADAPFLQGVAEVDRSAKVRRLAKRFLARLGAGPEEDADAAELAAFFTRY
ncbi:MAG: DUF5691 domain-containing protein [Pseudomonadota bacterium]